MLLRPGEFRRWINVCFLLVAFLPSYSQKEDIWHRGNGGLWLGIQYKHSIDKHWIWQNDLQLRFKNSCTVYDYTLIRSGIYYQLHKDVLIGTGILYGRNNVDHRKYPYWENEYRLWQDARWNIATGNSWKPGLQLRLEQRWFDNVLAEEINEQIFLTRYRIRTDLRKEFGANWRLLAGNELMYQSFKGDIRFNQDRVWLGAGYQLKKMEFQLLLMQAIFDKKDLTVIRLNALLW